MTISQLIIENLAPTGQLRASINLGNPILANRCPYSGKPIGVSIDLAQNFARKLGVDVELVVYDSAGKSFAAVAKEEADIGFFAIDPVREKDISFTAPYVHIEGAYMVNQSSKIKINEDVDRAGNRIVVGKGSAYDLYLTREIKHSVIVRAPTSPTVINTFLDQNLEVAAGVKQQLEADIKRFPNLCLLPGRFMVIQQAMGLPKGRGTEAANYLHQFIEEMKATGFIAEALSRHKIQGASVAPAD